MTFYPGMVRLPEGSAPTMIGVPMRITAKVEVPEDVAEGVILGDAPEPTGMERLELATKMD